MSDMTIENMHALGAAIRSIRHSRQLTLQYMEKATGVNSGNLSRIERGQQGVSMESLAKLARALGVSVVDVLATAETFHDVRGSPRVTGSPTLAVPCLQFTELGADKPARQRYYAESPTPTTFAVVLTGEPGFNRHPSLANVVALCDAAIGPQPKDLVVASVGGAPAIGEFRESAGRRFLVPLDGLPPISLDEAKVLGVVTRLIYERSTQGGVK